MQETLSTGSLNVLYAGAYHLYRNGKYLDAMHHFRFLTVQMPSAKKFWIGLGASYQMLNERDRAIQSYACAQNIDPQDPFPHLYAAECFAGKGDFQLCEEAISHARRLASTHPAKEKIISKIEVINKAYKDKRETAHGRS